MFNTYIYIYQYVKYIDISTHPHQNRQCQWPPTTSLHYRLTMTFQNLLRPKDTRRKPIYSYLGKRNNIFKNDLEGDMAVPWSVYLAGFFWRKIRTARTAVLWEKLPPKIKYTQGTSRVEVVRIFYTSLSALLKAFNNAMARCEANGFHTSSRYNLKAPGNSTNNLVVWRTPIWKPRKIIDSQHTCENRVAINGKNTIYNNNPEMTPVKPIDWKITYVSGRSISTCIRNMFLL